MKNFFSKDDPATNEHHYHITKQYNEEIHNIYNVDKNKIFNTKNNWFLIEQYFNKKQNVNHSITNNITNNTINNTGNVLNVKGYSYKTYISNNYKSQIAYVENKLYKRSGNRTFNNTDNIYKHTNQYSADVFDNSKMNKTHNVKKTHFLLLLMVLLLIRIIPLARMVHTM